MLDLDEKTAEDLKRKLQEPGDHERMAHYVDKNELMEATVNGTPLVALCGKKWVPTRDAKDFPVCPECKEIWEGMIDE